MEGAEFNIKVHNLWALMFVHHPHTIKPEKKLWLPSAAMWKSLSFPHLTFSRLPFPRREHSQAGAREREAIFHSLKHSFEFSCTVSKIFSPIALSISCHSEFSHKITNNWKTLTTHQPFNNEKVQMWVYLKLTKKKNSMKRKCHSRDLLGMCCIWNKWIRFSFPNLLF